MPRDLAMAHACWGPAPPNAARTCDAVSNPLLSVIWRMGRHMASLATLTYPSATSSTLISWSVPVRPSSRLIFWASASNADRVDAASRGSSSSAPKILGKYSGRTLPSSRLASVTARFAPPFL